MTVLVPLYSHPPHSTNVTTSHLVLYPSFSNAVPFRGMSYALLYFCAFLHKEYASLLFCCTFYGITTHTTPPSPHSLFSTPHCITWLLNISNLFWGIVFSFSPSALFLQFWARYPNLLQLKHIFPFLPSSSALNLARACFWLSMLLMRELYCVWDIVTTSLRVQWWGSKWIWSQNKGDNKWK